MNLDELKALEKAARQLEPSPNQREGWNRAVHAYSHAFLDSLQERNAYDAPAVEDGLFAVYPEEGRPMEELLAQLEQWVDRQGINPASGRHLGYVPGGGVYATALGDYLAAATNRYAGINFASPGAVKMENELIRWMCRLAGFPPNSLGNLTSGGSIANLIAITTARDALGVRAERVSKSVIYLTRQVHHCVQKALRIAGLAEAPIRYIDMDRQFRIRPDALEQQIRTDRAAGLTPFLLVASAGTTDTGAIDPLQDLAAIARAEGMWYHVDAAYGGFFLLSEKLRPLLQGIAQADSIVMDPHKGLFLSYGIGAVLIKDIKAQYRSYHYQANYMQDAALESGEPSPADLSPELTKHFRGLRMWLPLQLLGARPFKAAIEEKALLCRYFFHRAQEMGFETGPEPALSIMIFRHPGSEQLPAEQANPALIRKIWEDGQFFLSSTQIGGEYWIRLAVLSFRTHLQEIEALLLKLQQLCKELGLPIAQEKR
ncbi:pyridoxal phosphate-dependent decarboxylase family protein [Phaeodactylibacter luteus]|uniref:Aminotransferase class V-fold PLP-dependent enzyme n=1 Tax=Phaeodactylibacter luteus TaxID=1564516 RepID=A0A5C6RRB4_9BACT|nr:aminotransferase class V-fold PLP-dependent enzyme [Phaeodactylibacter luteus]TXB64891.1 aminotransferase class V-fold PLP-dependent enzyme [Phaeodactylibacter luteus]